MLTWNDAYATGVADIDTQHKRLFEIINEFGEAVKRGEGELKLEKAMKFLGHYAKIHFTFEEICMARHHCAVGEQNKKAHAYFLESYKKFQERLAREGCSEGLIKEIHAMCEDWLVNHICKIDVRLKDSVLKTGTDEQRRQRK